VDTWSFKFTPLRETASYVSGRFDNTELHSYVGYASGKDVVLNLSTQ
jgi:hypothetical protein